MYCKGHDRKRLGPRFCYYPSTLLEGLRKMRKACYGDISGSRFKPGIFLTFLKKWVLFKHRTFQSPSAVVDLAGILSCCIPA
jgi:intergrase/recombinase